MVSGNVVLTRQKKKKKILDTYLSHSDRQGGPRASGVGLHVGAAGSHNLGQLSVPEHQDPFAIQKKKVKT